MKFGKYLILGALVDLVDWIGIGFIPGVFDLLDLVMAYFWYRKLGAVGLTSAIEVIPVADILPTNIVLGFMADQKSIEGGKK